MVEFSKLFSRKFKQILEYKREDLLNFSRGHFVFIESCDESPSLRKTQW